MKLIFGPNGPIEVYGREEAGKKNKDAEICTPKDHDCLYLEAIAEQSLFSRAIDKIEDCAYSLFPNLPYYTAKILI